MENGISNLSIIPVRKETSDASEMVTQILFGEHFEILDKQKNWLYIRSAFDDYEGWIDFKQSVPISSDDVKELNKNPFHVSRDVVQVAVINDTIPIAVLVGSTLPFYSDKKFRIADTVYSFDGDAKAFQLPDSKLIIENSYLYLNSPYLWGGRSPFGIDCSGFTQMVFKLSGIKLKRDANQQAEQGQTINIIEEADPGDLLFFDNEEGKITHVGIMIGKDKIIHAHGFVRVDSIDHHGIFNKDQNKYTHSLRLIKRII